VCRVWAVMCRGSPSSSFGTCYTVDPSESVPSLECHPTRRQATNRPPAKAVPSRWPTGSGGWSCAAFTNGGALLLAPSASWRFNPPASAPGGEAVPKTGESPTCYTKLALPGSSPGTRGTLKAGNLPTCYTKPRHPLCLRVFVPSWPPAPAPEKPICEIGAICGSQGSPRRLSVLAVQSDQLALRRTVRTADHLIWRQGTA
jgi:hypothetical protein